MAGYRSAAAGPSSDGVTIYFAYPNSPLMQTGLVDRHILALRMCGIGWYPVDAAGRFRPVAAARAAEGKRRVSKQYGHRSRLLRDSSSAIAERTRDFPSTMSRIAGDEATRAAAQQ